MESNYLYLGLVLLALAYPLAQSFEKRIQFHRKWKYLFPAIFAMGFLFIPWDIIFTLKGVWWFNERYLTGITLLRLPIEEWLFFLIVPFACVFLYEVLNYFSKKDRLAPISRWLFLLLGLVFIGTGIVHTDRMYTFVTFTLTGVALLATFYFDPEWKGRFVRMYLVSWVPFLVLNGALTGNFTQEATVNYNPDEFLGIRITTIPLEDSIYSLLMLLIVIWVYESLINYTKKRTIL